jgi:predicted transcriptional regulator
MCEKRSKYQIIAHILGICRDSSSKTEIVHASNLNFKTVRPYLTILTQSDLMEAVGSEPTKYKTTKKGLNVLKHIMAVEEMIS